MLMSIHANVEVGFAELDCEVHKGTVRDAQWYSFGANKTHGKRRQSGDAKRAIEKILQDKEWSKTSQGSIAQHVGVSAQFVSKVKSTINQLIVRDEKPVGKDGRAINTANIGKAKPATKPDTRSGMSDERQHEAADDGRAPVTSHSRRNAFRFLAWQAPQAFRRAGWTIPLSGERRREIGLFPSPPGSRGTTSRASWLKTGPQYPLTEAEITHCAFFLT